MTCPADEALAAWAAGAVSDHERDALEAHAADCGACRVFAVTMAGVAPHRAAIAVGAEGATIGRYRVTGDAGHGAMGVVLRSHDPVLDREVAIKMVRDFAPADADRMLREAQTLARIDHGAVVRVYDAGLVGKEVFLAMEYVHGTTLRQWLADGSRSLRERLAALVDVGEGLAAVHARGLVHRDIKPDNILVRDSGRAVIVDFGLARPTGAGGATGSGIAGTPRYLAPEVLRGGPASAASDQFAWWTVVAETLEDLALPASRRQWRSTTSTATTS